MLLRSQITFGITEILPSFAYNLFWLLLPCGVWVFSWEWDSVNVGLQPRLRNRPVCCLFCSFCVLDARCRSACLSYGSWGSWVNEVQSIYILRLFNRWENYFHPTMKTTKLAAYLKFRSVTCHCCAHDVCWLQFSSVRPMQWIALYCISVYFQTWVTRRILLQYMLQKIKTNTQRRNTK